MLVSLLIATIEQLLAKADGVTDVDCQVAENGIIAIETLFARCNKDNLALVRQIVSIALTALAFDPNYSEMADTMSDDDAGQCFM